MAVRGWGGSVATAIGVAAGAGAAQLGLGYGLGIIAWLPTASGASEAAWVASLAWATWIAATSVVAGAITADRLGGAVTASSTPGPSAPDATPLTTALWRLALAVAAAVGALVTVALVAVPARAAVRADTFSPQTIAAGYAVIGVIVGLLVAVAALASRAVATNVIATVGFLWVLAIIAVIDGVASGRGLATAQLAVWQFTDTTPGYWFRNLYLPGLALSLGAAFVIGALAAWPAARREGGRVSVAISGAVGPMLVAAAYFLAAPRPNGVPGEQLSAYLVAPYTVIAGLAGSVLTAALVTRAEAARRAAETRAQEVRLPDLPMPDPVAEPYADADATTTTLPATDDPVRTDLADDGYAPARAYVSETASEPETSAVRGQATVKAPLWPEESTGGGDKGRGGLFGRGKGKPQT